MEQIHSQLGVNSSPATVGIPRGMRGYRVAISDGLRAKVDKNGGLDLGQLGKFLAQPVSDKVSMEVMHVFGCTGEGSAKLNLVKAFANYLEVSSDILNVTHMRDTPRSVVILVIEYPFSEANYDKVYDLFDVGHYSLTNARRPDAKAMEVFVAPTVLELQMMTSVKCISSFSHVNEAEAEEIVEVDMTPGVVGKRRQIDLADDDDKAGGALKASTGLSGAQQAGATSPAVAARLLAPRRSTRLLCARARETEASRRPPT